jgi:LEA14-like dessication related protein
MMHRILICLLVLAGVSCGVEEQADQIKALENCTYEIVAIDSAYVAGTEINKLFNKGGLNLLGLPLLALSSLQQKLPFSGIVQLKITNPGAQDAGINQFKYQVYIKDMPIIDGIVSREISVPANGGTTVIPLKIEKDIYPLISSSGNQRAIADFFTTSTEKIAPFTFKLKPSFLIGDKMVEYPDYFTFQKDVSNTTMLSYLSKTK